MDTKIKELVRKTRLPDPMIHILKINMTKKQKIK